MFSFYKLLEMLEQEDHCGNGKVCSRWKEKDNSCNPGCQQAGVEESGTCVYFNNEKNEQENCPCYILKKDEIEESIVIRKPEDPINTHRFFTHAELRAAARRRFSPEELKIMGKRYAKYKGEE